MWLPDSALRDADVAADALADLAVAALLDLLREERIGDRRPRGADQVPRAAERMISAIRSGFVSRADADDRLRRRLAHSAGPFELVALLEEARGARVLRPLDDRADVDVPEVDEVVGEPDEAEPLLELDAGRPERLDAEAHRDRAVVADRLAHGLERLEPEARAVLERAAVLVGALVVEGREELERQVRSARRRRRRCRTRRRASELGRAHPVARGRADVVELHRLGHDGTAS